MQWCQMLLWWLPEHYSDDLGMELEDSMEQDFNMKLEDGSPYEVRLDTAHSWRFTSALVNCLPFLA